MPRPIVAMAGLVAGILAMPATGVACPKPGPVTVRQHALGSVTAAWRPRAALRKARTSYRVLRGKAVVGQTQRTSMLVRGLPGRKITIKVGVVGAGGRAPRCWTARQVRVALPATLPAPADLAAQAAGDTRITLSWRPVVGARGYRVLKDDRPVGQTAGTTLAASVTPGRGARFAVAAVGLRGRIGPAASLTWAAGTRPPGAPSQLAAPVVTTRQVRLSWAAAPAGTAPVRAYRVFRNGQVVGQFTGTQATVDGLGQDRQYDVAVAAVDTQGVLGPSATLTFRTALPPASTGRLHAYVLASTDDSFRDLQSHYDQVGTAYPTYFNCSTADMGAIEGQDDPLITQWIRDRRIALMPRLNCQRPKVLGVILTDPAVRSRVINDLVSLALTYDYDGINLDFEAMPPSSRDGYTAFVRDLATALHAAGRRLSVDVSPKYRDDLTHPRSGAFDYPALADYADTLFVMGWGLHWSTSPPGAIAPADWLTKVYTYVGAQLNVRKFVMGMPMYGFDWAGNGGAASPATAVSYADVQALLAKYGVQPHVDPTAAELTFSYTDERGVPHQVWYQDGATLDQRFHIALDRGLGGVGVWRLGQEDPAFWSQPTVTG
ncbi:glycosyl hydrolase family 18 protein [Baekduia sp.]|uniref:glycosyl hydrolase family 18 protein n=1 Tax=Baekduia sp. TaxID=2600305 RepID=UPI002D78D028|nr:glycosyl hydrolase family 18 protein [Baekduia sp.]